MSGERRIQIIGNIPLPASLAEAGKLQTRVAEAVDAFAKELVAAGIPGEMTCKVVSARPAKAVAAVQAEAAPVAQAEAEPAPLVPPAGEPAVAAAPPPTPPWAR
jgi:hypothetical protein